jgi:RHS repeat-associated protein
MEPAQSQAFSEPLLAAMPQLSEKPHLGVPSSNPALYLGHEVCNSTTALGLQAALYLDRVQSRSTGKERDSESGNDYFKYRYLASSMGRWLSPDPSGLTHVDLGNPQELNLYNYVGNNPLTRADLDGLCIKGFQWACDIIQRIDNRLSGYGFQTDDQLLKTPNKRSQNKIGENRRQETSLKDLSKQPFKPIDLQFDPNAPPVPRLSVRATPAPKKPEPPGWYECLTVPGDATAAYRDSMAAYNSAAQGNSAPSDDDTSANGVGGGAVLLNLTGKGWSPQGSADAATKVNGAAAIADYGVSAGGCFVQH